MDLNARTALIQHVTDFLDLTDRLAERDRSGSETADFQNDASGFAYGVEIALGTPEHPAWAIAQRVHDTHLDGAEALATYLELVAIVESGTAGQAAERMLERYEQLLITE